MDKDLDYGDDDEEFVETEGEESHLKGALIALLVIVVICSLIILSIIILTPSIKYSEFHIESYKITEILSNEFVPKLFNGTWISGHEFIFKEDKGSVVIFNANTNNSTILVKSYITRQFNSQKFFVSSDRNFVLLISDFKKSRDFVFTANFIIHNIQTGEIINLDNLIDYPSIQWAEWGPKGNSLIFINNNDIHYIPYIGANVQRITNNGKQNVVFNGIKDMLYRENIISKESLLWWSKEGLSLCYATIDNSGVGDNIIVYYGSLDNKTESGSLDFVNFKFPKAKQMIAKIFLWIYNFSSSAVKQIIPPKSLLNKDFYLTHVNWVKEDRLTVIWTLKNQNNSIISSCFESKEWICEENIKISSAMNLKKLSQSVITSNDGLKYFMISLRPDSLIGSYYHIISFKLDENFLESFLTNGVFDVTKVLYFDEMSQIVYFEAKESALVETQHIYSIKINESKIIECISCKLSSALNNCEYFEAVFSPNAQYYILQCLGPDIPRVYLLELNRELNKTIELETNEELTNKMMKKLILDSHNFTVLSGNKKIHIKLLLPLGFDDEVVAKYPLVVEVNDPHTSVLKQTFDIGWSHHLVSEFEYIYGWVERDDEYRIHRKNIQNYEIINENIENFGIAFDYIKQNLLFIDSKRMCIWGSNIGAFVAISSLASNDIMRCAVLVSPVIDWRLIDVVTYEQLFNGMNLFEDYVMFEGFNLINKINKLIAKHILLIHGSADEKVSVQHSMQLIKQLVNEYSKSQWNSLEPLIQLQIYPDEDNSLYSIRHHMFRRIQLFLNQMFWKNHKTDDKKT